MRILVSDSDDPSQPFAVIASVAKQSRTVHSHKIRRRLLRFARNDGINTSVKATHQRANAVRSEINRAQMADILGRERDLPGRCRSRQAEALRARHVPLPVGRGPPRRASGGLHRDRHRLPLQADARLQRAAPDGLGRLRPARRALRHAHRRASRDHHATAISKPSAARSSASASPTTGSRELATTDPDYYSWTQWIFLKLFERGLAYQAEIPVNWCPAQGTVLANEEVKDGKYVETGDPVERRLMRQWMLRITAYADRLLDDLEALDWPEGIKAMQRNWIGQSRGRRRGVSRSPTAAACVHRLHDAPGHAVRRDLLRARAGAPAGRPDHDASAARRGRMPIVRTRRRRASCERTELAKEKTGVFTGAYADQSGERRAHARSGSPTTC